MRIVQWRLGGTIVATALLALLCTAPAGAAVVISDVIVGNAQEYQNGTPTGLWRYFITVVSSGITSLSVTGPDGAAIGMNQNTTGWARGVEGFASEAALRSAFPTGNYTFDINGGHKVFQVYFSGNKPDALATGIAPEDGETGVSLNPTFNWSPIITELSDVMLAANLSRHGEHTMAEAAPLEITTTQWACPLTLEAYTGYDLFVGVYRGTTGSDTVDGDSFPIYSVLGYDNNVTFTTGAPEPATLSLLALGGLAVIRRTKKA